jgi:hypothetical protein
MHRVDGGRQARCGRPTIARTGPVEWLVHAPRLSRRVQRAASDSNDCLNSYELQYLKKSLLAGPSAGDFLSRTVWPGRIAHVGLDESWVRRFADSVNASQ